MKAQLLIILVLACAAVLTSAAVAEGKRTLVIANDLSIKDTHSIFFKSLTDRGYKLKFKAAEGEIPLQKYGDAIYDNLILFAPKIEDAVTASEVLEFIDAGGNVLLAADTGASGTIRDIARGVGAELADSASSVIDHIHFDQSDFDGHHTTIIADEFIANTPVILGGSKPAPVLFRGIGQDVREGVLNYRVLSASGSAYSGRTDGKAAPLRLLGKKNGLVSALQARNGARVAVSGSIALFSDAFFTTQVQKYSQDGKAATVKSGNEQFAVELSKWVFAERGLLRFRDIQHSTKGGLVPAMYTVKENITYSIVIEEKVNGEWKGYKANDVQLEFVMLDPYWRITLNHDGNGKYSTDFQVPDVYGVFTFRVDYNRPGYTPIQAITRAPVRPFRHDQYERFIPSAYPYYAGAFSMLVGLFVFSMVFLFHREDPRKAK